MNLLKKIILVAAAFGATSVAAMDMTYKPAGTGQGRMEQWPSSITLEGPVEWGDDQKLREILAQYPDVEEVVIGRSPGGSLHAGIYMAEVLYEAGLPLRLEGPAASAATVISLGAKNQVTFGEASQNYRGTQLLFHCAYIQGETVCDGQATKILSEALASFTRRTADDWYSFLMEETTPDTVEPVRMFSLLSRSWHCASEDRRGTTCYRIFADEDLIGPIVSLGRQEIIEASRPSLDEALAYVSETGVSDRSTFRIFESSNGWFAISRQDTNARMCAGYLSDFQEMDLGGYPPADAFCSSGDNFVRKFDGATGDEIPVSNGQIIPVYQVKNGTMDGYIRLYATNSFNGEILAKISEGERFFVELVGGDFWRVRDQATRSIGWIYANHEIESLHR